MRPVLFTQSTCAESSHVRTWLSERGIAVEERNVTIDDEALGALLATGLFATPLLVVGDEAVVGFRPERLAAALSRVQPPLRLATHEEND